MAKIDPYTLPRPKRPVETRTFTEDGEDAPLTLTLRRLSYPDDAAAREEAQGLVETFITGNELRGPAPFPDLDITPSQRLFVTAAQLARMQCPPDPADAYDTMEILTLSVRQPKNFVALVAWANTIDQGGESAPGE